MGECFRHGFNIDVYVDGSLYSLVRVSYFVGLGAGYTFLFLYKECSHLFFRPRLNILTFVPSSCCKHSFIILSYIASDFSILEYFGMSIFKLQLMHVFLVLVTSFAVKRKG